MTQVKDVLPIIEAMSANARRHKWRLVEVSVEVFDDQILFPLREIAKWDRARVEQGFIDGSVEGSHVDRNGIPEGPALAELIRPIVNDWFDKGHEEGRLETSVLAERIAAAFSPETA